MLHPREHLSELVSAVVTLVDVGSVGHGEGECYDGVGRGGVGWRGRFGALKGG